MICSVEWRFFFIDPPFQSSRNPNIPTGPVSGGQVTPGRTGAIEMQDSGHLELDPARLISVAGRGGIA